MIVCGHQPNFLPYLGFFHKMMHCDQFVIVDNVEFVGKGPFGWIHRNKIRIHNKDEHWLTVPVYQKGRFHQKINEVEINNQEHWRRKHWKAIRLNYQQSPYFDEYADELKKIYEQEWDKLINLNRTLLEWIIDCLDIEVPIAISSKQGIEGKETDLVINLCEAFGGDIYLSGTHGKDYLDRERIEESAIEILFQEFDHPTYPQPRYDDFVSHLSVVDLLFNCGPDSRGIIEGAGSFSKNWNSTD